MKKEKKTSPHKKTTTKNSRVGFFIDDTKYFATEIVENPKIGNIPVFFKKGTIPQDVFNNQKYPDSGVDPIASVEFFKKIREDIQSEKIILQDVTNEKKQQALLKAAKIAGFEDSSVRDWRDNIEALLVGGYENQSDSGILFFHNENFQELLNLYIVKDTKIKNTLNYSGGLEDNILNITKELKKFSIRKVYIAGDFVNPEYIKELFFALKIKAEVENIWQNFFTTDKFIPSIFFEESHSYIKPYALALPEKILETIFSYIYDANGVSERKNIIDKYKKTFTNKSEKEKKSSSQKDTEKNNTEKSLKEKILIKTNTEKNRLSEINSKADKNTNNLLQTSTKIPETQKSPSSPKKEKTIHKRNIPDNVSEVNVPEMTPFFSVKKKISDTDSTKNVKKRELTEKEDKKQNQKDKKEKKFFSFFSATTNQAPESKKEINGTQNTTSDNKKIIQEKSSQEKSSKYQKTPHKSQSQKNDKKDISSTNPETGKNNLSIVLEKKKKLFKKINPVISTGGQKIDHFNKSLRENLSSSQKEILNTKEKPDKKDISETTKKRITELQNRTKELHSMPQKLHEKHLEEKKIQENTPKEVIKEDILGDLRQILPQIKKESLENKNRVNKKEENKKKNKENISTKPKTEKNKDSSSKKDPAKSRLEVKNKDLIEEKKIPASISPEKTASAKEILSIRKSKLRRNKKKHKKFSDSEIFQQKKNEMKDIASSIKDTITRNSQKEKKSNISSLQEEAKLKVKEIKKIKKNVLKTKEDPIKIKFKKTQEQVDDKKAVFAQKLSLDTPPIATNQLNIKGDVKEGWIKKETPLKKSEKELQEKIDEGAKVSTKIRKLFSFSGSKKDSQKNSSTDSQK